MRDAQEVFLAYGRLFSTQDGQAVLEDLRKSFGDKALVEIHARQPVDPIKMAVMEGRRQVYLLILQAIEAADHYKVVGASGQAATYEEFDHAG